LSFWPYQQLANVSFLTILPLYWDLYNNNSTTSTPHHATIKNTMTGEPREADSQRQRLSTKLWRRPTSNDESASADVDRAAPQPPPEPHADVIALLESLSSPKQMYEAFNVLIALFEDAKSEREMAVISRITREHLDRFIITAETKLQGGPLERLPGELVKLQRILAENGIDLAQEPATAKIDAEQPDQTVLAEKEMRPLELETGAAHWGASDHFVPEDAFFASTDNSFQLPNRRSSWCLTQMRREGLGNPRSLKPIPVIAPPDLSALPAEKKLLAVCDGVSSTESSTGSGLAMTTMLESKAKGATMADSFMAAKERLLRDPTLWSCSDYKCPESKRRRDANPYDFQTAHRALTDGTATTNVDNPTAEQCRCAFCNKNLAPQETNALLVEIDTSTRKLNYAGVHDPALIIIKPDGSFSIEYDERKQNREIQLSRANREDVITGSIDLDPGDIVVLTTDGLLRWASLELFQRDKWTSPEDQKVYSFLVNEIKREKRPGISWTQAAERLVARAYKRTTEEIIVETNPGGTSFTSESDDLTIIIAEAREQSEELAEKPEFDSAAQELEYLVDQINLLNRDERINCTRANGGGSHALPTTVINTLRPILVATKDGKPIPRMRGDITQITLSGQIYDIERIYSKLVEQFGAKEDGQKAAETAVAVEKANFDTIEKVLEFLRTQPENTMIIRPDINRFSIIKRRQIPDFELVTTIELVIKGELTIGKLVDKITLNDQVISLHELINNHENPTQPSSVWQRQ